MALPFHIWGGWIDGEPAHKFHHIETEYCIAFEVSTSINPQMTQRLEA
jgi:hypothetical protein